MIRSFNKLLAITALLAFSTDICSQIRVASFGSNPDFSYSLFPQDVSKIRANNISAFSSYRKSPWWGDIDQFDNKPNGTYTITGNQVIKSSAFFQESAKMQTTQNQAGYNYRPSEEFAFSIDGNFTVNHLSDIAKGNFTYDNNGTREGYLPFDYTLRHTLYDFNLNSVTAFKFRNIPVGAMLSLGKENTMGLHKELNFIRGQDTVSSERALWGWAKVGCNHIFGVKGTEGDAWFQNDYSTGPLYKLNFQAGADFEKVKAGVSIYAKAGSQDYYYWNEDTSGASKLTSDTLLNERFVGSYVKSDWEKKSHQSLISAYGNIHLMEQERFGIHSFVSLSYNGDKTGHTLNGNDNVEDDRKETVRGFALEFSPNINIKLGERLNYIDLAILSRYNYNRYNNTMMAWINGGRTKTYWDGYVDQLDETVWETFSYANQNIFDIGFDISTMFPVLNNSNLGNLGFGFMLYGKSRLNFQTKYYGDNQQVGSENDFSIFARRYNYTREIKFNTSLLFDYTFSPLRMRLEVTEPVLHNLLQKTTYKTETEKKTHRKDPLWLSQQGLQLGLFATYDFHFSFLRYENTGY